MILFIIISTPLIFNYFKIICFIFIYFSSFLFRLHLLLLFFESSIYFYTLCSFFNFTQIHLIYLFKFV